MSSIFILAAMIFLHIIDDYVLQAPCLCDLKQKSFWEKNAPQPLYKDDYKVAVAMHAFSWSFMTMLPIAVALNFNVDINFAAMLVINTVFHALVDDLKANQYKINLCADQAYHIFQIILTFTCYELGVFNATAY
jgi:hypothetical protein